MKGAGFAIPFLVLTACPPTGVPCGDAGICPITNLCIYGQCQTPNAALQNLSAVVTPSTPNLPPQQFLPGDLTPISGGQYIIDLQPPQQLFGHVSLPPSCAPDAGFPVLLHFEAQSLIPSIPATFDFIDNGPPPAVATPEDGGLDAGSSDAGLDGGAVLVVLPTQFNFQLRATTATACTFPVVSTHATVAGTFPLAKSVLFPAEVPWTITGVIFPSANGSGKLMGASVRIVEPGKGAISADTTLQASTATLDGGYAFSLPVIPPSTSPQGVCGPPLCLQNGTQASFFVELGPSASATDFPTVDLPVIDAPLLLIDAGVDAGADGGIDAGTIDALQALIVAPAITMPIPVGPQASVPVNITAADALGLLPAEVVVDIASNDGGLFGCDGGCSFHTQGLADPTLTSQLLPGNYTLTLEPPPPDGWTSLDITVLDGGIWANGVVLDGGFVNLVALSPQEVTGTALKPAPGKGPVLGGQALVLSLPDLTPVALQPLDAGFFDLLVPPGPSYLLLVQPANGTTFATFQATFSVSAPPASFQPPWTSSFHVQQASVLSGVVRLLSLDDTPPTPVPNALIQFYSVTSNPAGQSVALPIASAVTDEQGNWSAPGPTTE